MNSSEPVVEPPVSGSSRSPSFTIDDYIPFAEFSPDHWSTLAYIETQIVDCAGFQVGCDARMRQGRRNHRIMLEHCPRPRRANPTRPGDAMVMDLKYSTRLRGGQVVDGHDDWACVQDMAEAGFFTVGPEAVEPGEVLHLSARGRRFVESLRAHKAAGGTWRAFSPGVVADGAQDASTTDAGQAPGTNP